MKFASAILVNAKLFARCALPCFRAAVSPGKQFIKGVFHFQSLLPRRHDFILSIRSSRRKLCIDSMVLPFLQRSSNALQFLHFYSQTMGGFHP